MKKVLIAVLCLSTLFGYAQQLSLKKLDGTTINDGDVFLFNQLTEPGNYLGLKIYNTSADDIMLIKARVLSITNSTGSNLQLCVGDVCLSTITAGNSYPNIPAEIEPLGSNSNFDHLLNNNPGIDTNLPVEYVVKIYQVNDAGAEVGNSVTFTYRYSATLGNNTFNLDNMGVAFKSTLVNDMLEIKSTKDVQMDLFDVNGKLVGRHNVAAGDSSIDVSGFGTGVYIANFKNDEGHTASAKIVKK